MHTLEDAPGARTRRQTQRLHDAILRRDVLGSAVTAALLALTHEVRRGTIHHDDRRA